MSNWWAQRLNQGAPPPPPVPAAPPVPAYRPPAAVTKLPPSAKETGTCPDCGSGNYMSAPGSQYYRCLDCGYPIVQSGSGVGMVHSDAPIKKAMQVPTEGYQPGRIVGRVE